MKNAKFSVRNPYTEEMTVLPGFSRKVINEQETRAILYTSQASSLRKQVIVGAFYGQRTEDMFIMGKNKLVFVHDT